MEGGNEDKGENPLRTGLVQLEYRCYRSSILLIGTIFCPVSSMERMSDYGSEDRGSTPLRGTISRHSLVGQEHILGMDKTSVRLRLLARGGVD